MFKEKAVEQLKKTGIFKKTDNIRITRICFSQPSIVEKNDVVVGTIEFSRDKAFYTPNKKKKTFKAKNKPMTIGNIIK